MVRSVVFWAWIGLILSCADLGPENRSHPHMAQGVQGAGTVAT